MEKHDRATVLYHLEVHNANVAEKRTENIIQALCIRSRHVSSFYPSLFRISLGGLGKRP